MTARAVFGADRYRTIDEATIIRGLVSEGWRYEVAMGQRPAAEQAARAALERCVSLGLAFRRSSNGSRLFDPAEVSNIIKWTFRALGEGIWESQFLPSSRRQVWEAYRPSERGSGAPPDLATLPSQRYVVSVRRSFNLANRKPGERIRLRLPLPLEDAFLSDLSIEFLAPGSTAVEAMIAPARLDAVVSPPDSGELCIGVRTTFTARAVIPAPATSLDATAFDLYTRPNEGLIRLSPRVCKLASELAGADRDPLAVVRRFWAFLLNEMNFGLMHYDAVDPAEPLDWVLAHGWFDCKFGSALLAALCRARRIPARLVTGYPLRVISPGFHTWAEVWIDGQGWLPIDLAAWNLSAGGRDEDWRDYYFGRLDHRMTVERLPHLFSGWGAQRLPEVWHMLIDMAEPGTEVTFQDVDTGMIACREQIDVVRLPPPDG